MTFWRAQALQCQDFRRFPVSQTDQRLTASVSYDRNSPRKTAISAMPSWAPTPGATAEARSDYPPQNAIMAFCSADTLG
jgi:hypothetical protein